ncbi:MAG TPA: DUF4129 domain-containing protein [Thermomicrobiales bacterium]|jgi:hypothetical protein|nr:DUF4129 domain-containing protein [Thermomicrobiales bacterium]
MSKVADRPSVVHRLTSNWFSVRISAAVAVALAAVLWLAVESLTPEHVGPIALPPFIIMALLIGLVADPRVVPTAGGAVAARARPSLGRQLRLLGVVVLAMLVMIRGLAFPGRDLLDLAWLPNAARGLIFRADDAAMPVWVPIGLTALVSWRRGQTDDGIDETRTTFRLGTGILLVLAAIGAFSGMAPEGRIAIAAALFFAAMLLALNWARQAEVHPGERSGSGLVPALSGIGSVVGVLVLGIGLASLASPAAFSALMWLLSPVIWLVRMAVLGLSYLIFFLLYPFFWLFERLIGDGAVPPEPPQETSPQASFEAIAEQGAENAVNVPDGLRIVLAAIVLVLLFAIVLRVVLKQVLAASPMTDVEQHSEMDLRSLFRRRRSRKNGPATDPLAALRADPRYRDTVVIRETYAAFLRAAATAGLARRRPETAHHHARRVAAAIGRAPAELETLAGGYGPVRYGEAPATADERSAVVAAWQRVQPELTRLRVAD